MTIIKLCQSFKKKYYLQHIHEELPSNPNVGNVAGLNAPERAEACDAHAVYKKSPNLSSNDSPRRQENSTS